MVALDHTIVWCRDTTASANDLAGILGSPEPVPAAPTLPTPDGHLLEILTRPYRSGGSQ